MIKNKRLSSMFALFFSLFIDDSRIYQSGSLFTAGSKDCGKYEGEYSV